MPELPPLDARAPGRPLRVALMTFYNYQSHALRIFHPLLTQRGHEVHSVFFYNSFTYVHPTPEEEDMVVDFVVRLKPDVVAMSVWSTYYQLAARLTRRIKAATGAVVIWGGIHPQTCAEECLADADIACRGEGEYVLAELTDRLSLGQPYDDLEGCWVRTPAGITRNPLRPLITELDVLPPADLTSDGKHYFAFGRWRDAPTWDQGAVSYDIMTVRGCPYQCSFCIHNFTRPLTAGMGSYIRRRSVEHVMRELRAAVAARPKLRTIAFSDDIFSPPRPWMEEFCDVYRREIGLPFILYSFPGMVDETKVRLLRQAGLWYTTMGIQSGSERIRRECYGRHTADETIIEACRIFRRYGVGVNLDFIGQNPYETREDHLATLDLLCRLPKPFYFNYFSLTYFPGVDLTERALRDGYITPEDIEHVAQKGYRLYGGHLMNDRDEAELYWDVAYGMAVHGVPAPLIRRLMDTEFYSRHIRGLTRQMRRVRKVARAKQRLADRLARRPNLLQQFSDDATRTEAPAAGAVQPNFDSSPFSQPV